MAAMRTRRMAGPDPSRTTVARALAIAEQLHHECSILLDLYVSTGAGNVSVSASFNLPADHSISPEMKS